MIGPGSNAKILIATKPIDFRRGLDSLVALVQNEMHQDPFAGVMYVFRSRRSDRLKILWCDQSGLWLMTKRLEQGSFVWPQEHDGTYRLTAAQMSALLSGMDWRRMHAPRKTTLPKVKAAVPFEEHSAAR